MPYPCPDEYDIVTAGTTVEISRLALNCQCHISNLLLIFNEIKVTST